MHFIRKYALAICVVIKRLEIASQYRRNYLTVILFEIASQYRRNYLTVILFEIASQFGVQVSLRETHAAGITWR